MIRFILISVLKLHTLGAEPPRKLILYDYRCISKYINKQVYIYIYIYLYLHIYIYIYRIY